MEEGGGIRANSTVLCCKQYYHRCNVSEEAFTCQHMSIVLLSTPPAEAILFDPLLYVRYMRILRAESEHFPSLKVFAEASISL